MSSNIPGNVTKHSGECRQIFRGMSSNILGNVPKHFGECRQTFRKMSPNIPGNVVKHFGECSGTIQRIFENNMGHVVKHPVESMKSFGWMHVIVLDTGDHELYLFVEEPLSLNSRKRKSKPKLLNEKQEHFKLMLLLRHTYMHVIDLILHGLLIIQKQLLEVFCKKVFLKFSQIS